MKPVDFRLHRPTTLPEALDLLTAYGTDAKVLAGGQSLVPLLNFRLARPSHVIAVDNIRALQLLERTSEEVRVGAMVTYAQAQRSTGLAAAAPLLAAALPHVAHQAIRARGTIGGSIAHGDPAGEMPAVAVALDATMVAASSRGTRLIAAEDFFRTNLVTALADDELLVEVRYPSAAPSTGAAFEEVARRSGDFALAGAGAQLQLDPDGYVTQARIAVTGVASRPYRAVTAEEALIGHRVEPDLAAAAAQSVRADLAPTDDLHATGEYRKHVAGTLVSRALLNAASNAIPAVTKEAS